MTGKSSGAIPRGVTRGRTLRPEGGMGSTRYEGRSVEDGSAAGRTTPAESAARDVSRRDAGRDHGVQRRRRDLWAGRTPRRAVATRAGGRRCGRPRRARDLDEAYVISTRVPV